MTAATLRPSPAPALEAAFEAVLNGPMRGMPMVNRALRVEAVGFRPWNGHWLGVLVTPWFMNLWLMPQDDAAWSVLGEREKRRYTFPAGRFEFIGGRHPALGDYQACSLFSPMFEFADAEAARATASAALDALFDRGEPAVAAAPAAAPPAGEASRRRFLFGATRDAGEGA